MRLKKNVLESPYRKIKLKRYTSSNKETPVILLSQLLINNRTTLYSTPKTAPLLVRSSIATTPYRKVTAVYALNYLKLQFLSANIIALIGTVLYNAIKEYYNDRTRKIIYFYSYTIEAIHANYIKNSRSNVTMPDDYYNNNVNNILIKCIDNKQQRYNILIEDYNRAEKREDNILTIDECRTSHSNKKDIEANEREEETRVRLRELSEKIHDILLREFRRANDFIESIIYNNDEQLEDCDALVERYKEEINCSNLYSTI
ncbi:hypothetical protein HBH79_232910 [Parastagonospora nodorum]|nr:hypothetical protein HBH87_241150 [Parastagonospora nodorum]KAH4653490.1 hypothetical protein HBH79_232910 [Parastagonospora nodorum]